MNPASPAEGFLRASLVRFTDATGATAEFKREDGALFTIAVDKFSPEDKAELQKIFASSRPKRVPTNASNHGAAACIAY